MRQALSAVHQLLVQTIQTSRGLRVLGVRWEGFSFVREMVTLADREEIAQGRVELLEFKDIAARIGRDPSVVSREVVDRTGRTRRTGPRPAPAPRIR
jgi:hypothetical protein